MDAHRVRGGPSPPPLPTKIVGFFDFFEENSIFLGVFGSNSMPLPPLPEKVCRPLEKIIWVPFFEY